MRRFAQSAMLFHIWLGISGVIYAQSANSDGDFAEAIASLEANGSHPTLDRTNTFNDVDQNGVRDDIDAHIDSLAESVELKTNLRQFAKSTQLTLVVDVNDPVALESASSSLTIAAQCVAKAVGDDFQAALKHTQKIHAYTANTRERAFASMRFSEALDGHVLELLHDPVCNGDDSVEMRRILKKNTERTTKKNNAPTKTFPTTRFELTPCPPMKLSEVKDPSQMAKHCKPTIIRK